MIELAQPPTLPAAREKGVSLWPTFFGALRAIWLFTWKSRLTWRRLPMALVNLLILPVLVYITTQSPEKWSRQHAVMLGNPKVEVSELLGRLRRARVQAQPDQTRMAILTEAPRKTPAGPSRGTSGPDLADRA